MEGDVSPQLGGSRFLVGLVAGFPTCAHQFFTVRRESDNGPPSQVLDELPWLGLGAALRLRRHPAPGGVCDAAAESARPGPEWRGAGEEPAEVDAGGTKLGGLGRKDPRAPRFLFFFEGGFDRKKGLFF